MNRIRSTSLLVGVAVGTGLVFGAEPSPATSLCSVHTLSGSYGYIVNGTNVGGNAPSGQPWNSIQTIDSDAGGVYIPADIGDSMDSILHPDF